MSCSGAASPSRSWWRAPSPSRSTAGCSSAERATRWSMPTTLTRPTRVPGMSTYRVPAPPQALGRERSHALFGEVMGLVAITCLFAALGAYIGRDMHGLSTIIPWIAAFGALFGLNVANARGMRGLALTLLFAVGLLLGIAIGYIVNVYAETNPSAVWQAAGATGLFVGGLGAAGYATRRDLSSLYRFLFFALLAL